MMKKTAAMLLAGVMALSLAACGGSSSGSAGNAGNAAESTSGSEDASRTDVTIANSVVINDLDPANWYLGTQTYVFQNVYSPLLDVVVTDDNGFEARPNLASSFELSDDKLAWTFHLNEKAVYSNGDPVTAADVMTCFERCMANPYTMDKVSMVESFEAPDDHTFVIHLTAPTRSAPYCWGSIAVYNPALYDADKEEYVVSPVGSGPYELVSADTTTGTYQLKRKAEWWGDTMPAIETINIKTISDTNTLVVALESGEVDYGAVSGMDANLVRASDKLALTEMLSFEGRQVILNQTREQMQNKDLRKAIGYALDYEALRGLSGEISPLDSTLRFASPDLKVPDDIEQFVHDPDKARQILKDAGIQTPVNLGKIMIVGGSFAEMVKQNLAEVGIEAEVETVESNSFAQRLMGGDFDISVTTSAAYLSGQENLQRLYGTGELFNFSHYSNPELDEIIAAMQTATDEEYQKLGHDALAIIADDCPVYGIGMGLTYAATNKNLHFGRFWDGFDVMTAHWE